MIVRKSTLGLILLFALVLSACTGPAMTAAEEPAGAMATGDAMMETGDSDAMMADTGADEMQAGEGEMMDGTIDESMTESGMSNGHDGSLEDSMMKEQPTADMGSSGDMAQEEESMMAAPNWFSVALQDPTTGETFTVGDFKGRVVLVETLAMWCSNCMRQQQQVKALHEALGEREDFISLGLDIDPNKNTADLKDYVARNGFDWTYAVAPPEVARELGNMYGAQFLNPPSTPMLIIDPKGEVHPLRFGIKSAEELHKSLQPFLDQGM